MTSSFEHANTSMYRSSIASRLRAMACWQASTIVGVGMVVGDEWR